MEGLAAQASTPTDHRQLNKHFVEMAARYTADADAHAAMAASYRRSPGNSNRRTFRKAAIQCDRLAEGARKAAATARELATYHERLAAGTPASEVKAPTNDTALPMADAEVHELIVNAKSPAEHTRLRQYFATEAERYTADADRHAGMAAGYVRNPDRRSGNPEIHCTRLAQQLRAAATAARTLASYHEGLAAPGAK
jgi:hypothetical protein